MFKEDEALRVRIEIVGDETNGVYTATATDPFHRVGIGSARKMPEDKFDAPTGENLAVGRALKDLGQRIEREAFDYVHYLDEVRESQREASEEMKRRKAENTYRFQCEFAELINAKISQDLVEGEAIEPRFNGRIQNIVASRINVGEKKESPKADPFRAGLPA